MTQLHSSSTGKCEKIIAGIFFGALFALLAPFILFFFNPWTLIGYSTFNCTCMFFGGFLCGYNGSFPTPPSLKERRKVEKITRENTQFMRDFNK